MVFCDVDLLWTIVHDAYFYLWANERRERVKKANHDDAHKRFLFGIFQYCGVCDDVFVDLYHAKR